MIPSRPQNNTCAKPCITCVEIYLLREKLQQKTRFIFSARFYDPVQPRTSAKAKAINVNRRDVKPCITCTSPVHGFMMQPSQNPPPKAIKCQQRPSKKMVAMHQIFQYKTIGTQRLLLTKNYTHLFDLKLHSAKWSLQDLKLQTEMYVEVCTNGLGRFQQKHREIWGH